MSDKISIDQLADAVMDALDEYNDMAQETVRKSVQEVAKQTKVLIESAAPTDTGVYEANWATKTTLQNASRMEQVVYQKKKPGLAHLLEKGHAKQNGGRAPALVHIAPAEKYAVEELKERIARGLSQ